MVGGLLAGRASRCVHGLYILYPVLAPVMLSKAALYMQLCGTSHPPVWCVWALVAQDLLSTCTAAAGLLCGESRLVVLCTIVCTPAVHQQLYDADSV
jgi:hypothetical protein